jgi:hypothetical protein
MLSDRDERYKEIGDRLTDTVKARLEPMFRALYLNDTVLTEVSGHVVADVLNAMYTQGCAPQPWLPGQWCTIDFSGIVQQIEAAVR